MDAVAVATVHAGTSFYWVALGIVADMFHFKRWRMRSDRVPKELYEAAQIDCAGPWARFWNITWPIISPVTLFQVIVSTIAYVQIFTQPYLLAQQRINGPSGGPHNSMLTYSVYLFQNAFVYLKMGYASAMAWILFLLTMGITALILVNSRRWVHYGSR